MAEKELAPFTFEAFTLMAISKPIPMIGETISAVSKAVTPIGEPVKMMVRPPSIRAVIKMIRSVAAKEM